MWRCLTAVISGALCYLGLHAADISIGLEAIPASVTLDPGEKRTITLLARNMTTEAVDGLRLTSLPSDGVKVTVAPDRTSLLAPGSIGRWTAEVMRNPDSIGPEEVNFLAEWQASSSRSESAAGYARLPLPVLLTPPIEPEKIFSVRIESALKLLQEPRRGIVYVTVKNLSAHEITLRSIDPKISQDVTGKWIDDPRNFVLPRQSEQEFALQLTAKDAVESGKHLLLTNTTVQWIDSGRTRTANSVSKFEYDVGVVGDSEILTLLGVPSLFLLPGFLMIVIFALLWNRVGSDRPKIPVDAKSSEFWTLAVLLSLLTMSIYPWLSGRNYLNGYGLKDIKQVWFGSCIVATLVWMLCVAYVWISQRRAADRKREVTYLPGDEPVEILRKLARNGMGLTLPQGDVTFENKKVRAIVLARSDGKMVVAPIIQLSWPEDLDEKTKAEIERAVNAQLSKVDQPSELADLIANQRWGTAAISAAWLRQPPLIGVTEVDSVDMDSNTRAFVELKE